METQTDSYTPSIKEQASAGNAEHTHKQQFFAYPELTQCLALITNLAENTELIPLIKGQEGSGKTTLLLQLQSQAPSHWTFCHIIANPMMHAEQLYIQLSDAFDLTEEDVATKQELLIHFEALRHEGILPVIAIDDAHLLPTDTIVELLQLQSAATSQYSHLLHIILFAAPAINDLLQTQAICAVNNQTIHILDIPPLNSEQATAYITHILNSQNIPDSLALTPSQIEKITHASRGLPGRIESLLTMLPAQPIPKKKSTEKSGLKLLLEDLPITAIIGTIGLVSIISGILLFQDEINTIFNAATPNTTLIQEVSSEKSAEIAVELPTLVEAEQKTEPPSQKTTPVEELEPILEIAEQPTPVAISTDTPEIKQEAIVQEAPILVEAKVEPQAELPESPATPVLQDKKTHENTDTVIAEPITTNELIPAVSEEVVAAPKPITPPKKIKKGLKREAWLLSQKPTSYTLQIVGLQDEPSLYEYIERHKLAGELAYFKTTRDGHSWYPLLYGIYPGRSVALAAQEKLSAKLQQKDIWIRNIASVHKEINAQK